MVNEHHGYMKLMFQKKKKKRHEAKKGNKYVIKKTRIVFPL